MSKVAFSDMINLAEGFGIYLVHVLESHHLLTNPDIPELINLQSVRGEAKPYQSRQLLRLVERF